MQFMPARHGALVSVIVCFSFVVLGCVRAPDELVVYSARNEQLIKPMFDRYTAQTGQQIRFVTDDAGPLIERLAAGALPTPRGRCSSYGWRSRRLCWCTGRGLLLPV